MIHSELPVLTRTNTLLVFRQGKQKILRLIQKTGRGRDDVQPYSRGTDDYELVWRHGWGVWLEIPVDSPVSGFAHE